MGQSLTICQHERQSKNSSVDLANLNNDQVQRYTLNQMEKIQENIFNMNQQQWSYDTTKGHVQSVYKNEIIFFWHESDQPKLTFNIKAMRRTVVAPFSFFNRGPDTIKLEFPETNDLEEKIYYKTMNHADFAIKFRELKLKEHEDFEETEGMY